MMKRKSTSLESLTAFVELDKQVKAMGVAIERLDRTVKLLAQALCPEATKNYAAARVATNMRPKVKP